MEDLKRQPRNMTAMRQDIKHFELQYAALSEEKARAAKENANLLRHMQDQLQDLKQNRRELGFLLSENQHCNDDLIRELQNTQRHFDQKWHKADQLQQELSLLDQFNQDLLTKQQQIQKQAESLQQLGQDQRAQVQQLQSSEHGLSEDSRAQEKRINRLMDESRECELKILVVSKRVDTSMGQQQLKQSMLNQTQLTLTQTLSTIESLRQ